VLEEGQGRDGVVVAVVEESSHEQAVFGVIVIVIVEQTATHACSLLLTCLHITC
jgi:hypothetical protein